MLEIEYAPEFIRTWKKLPAHLQEESMECIEEFRNRKNHEKLKVHKLKGAMKGLYSFSVNYRYRIVFIFAGKGTAQLLDIGDHSVYER